MDRRTFLQYAGAAGAVGLAGCVEDFKEEFQRFKENQELARKDSTAPIDVNIRNAVSEGHRCYTGFQGNFKNPTKTDYDELSLDVWVYEVEDEEPYLIGSTTYRDDEGIAAQSIRDFNFDVDLDHCDEARWYAYAVHGVESEN